MGIEPFLIASCLNGVVAQRLLRVLCPKCKKLLQDTSSIPKEFLVVQESMPLQAQVKHFPNHHLRKSPKVIAEGNFLDKGDAAIYQAQGCQDCLRTGFSGRIGIFEIMEMAPQIGRLIVEKSSSDEIVNFCRTKGMEFLYDDGWKKVLNGITSPAELFRILGA